MMNREIIYRNSKMKIWKERHTYIETLRKTRSNALLCQEMDISEGKSGYMRVNKGGKLYSLIYGEVSSLSITLIEKEAVFHFYPGSRWLSLESGGNFRCPAVRTGK
jgi:pyruvate formate lyase activating enzyme